MPPNQKWKTGEYKPKSLKPRTPPGKTNFSIQFDTRDMNIIRQRAYLLGITTAEYIRTAILARLNNNIKLAEVYLDDIHQEIVRTRRLVEQALNPQPTFWDTMKNTDQMETVDDIKPPDPFKPPF